MSDIVRPREFDRECRTINTRKIQPGAALLLLAVFCLLCAVAPAAAPGNPPAFDRMEPALAALLNAPPRDEEVSVIIR
jgi:hypothetical protein